MTIEEAYTKFYDEIVRKAYRLLGNRDDAEDVAQEVFLRCAQKTKHPRCVRGWLHKIARDEVAMRLRIKAMQRRKAGMVAVPLCTADPEPRSDIHSLVQKAVEELTPAEQAAVAIIAGRATRAGPTADCPGSGKSAPSSICGRF